MNVTFTVPAVPVPQPRQRTAVIAGHVRNYTPTRHPVTAYKATVRLAWQATGCEPFDGPVELRLVFVMPRPKSKTRKSHQPREPYTSSRNDWDNLGKSTCDALNGLAWRDDGQIAVAHVERWIAATDEQPHVEIEVGGV